MDSCQGERGHVEGFKRKRLRQSCVLESSLTAGWRTAQRGRSRCGERGGQNGDGGGNGEAGAGVSLDLPGAQGPARKPTARYAPSSRTLSTAECESGARHLAGPPAARGGSAVSPPVHRWGSEVPHRGGPSTHPGWVYILFSTQAPPSHILLPSHLPVPICLALGISAAVSCEESKASAPLSQVRAPRP